MVTDSLSRYRAWRDFRKTAERSGDVAVKSFNRGRFVVRNHDAVHRRYDQRMEIDRVFGSLGGNHGTFP